MARSKVGPGTDGMAVYLQKTGGVYGFLILCLTLDQ